MRHLAAARGAGRPRGPARLPAVDPTLVRRLERSLAHLQPDPFFRWRLRGLVVSSFVAEREGFGIRPRGAREMGRLGRAVLYASLATALSVSAVGAASQDALPGEPLYGFKLRLEEVRMQVAPPAVRGELAAMALDERLDELERLADARAWSLVATAAMRVAEAQERVDAVQPGRTGAERRAAHARKIIEDVLAASPSRAGERLERVIDPATPGASGSQGSSAAAQGSSRRSQRDDPTQARSPSDPKDGARVDRSDHDAD